MKKWLFTWIAVFCCAALFGNICLASEPQTVIFDEGEDRTALGYNTSMNFWFVGGEVAYAAKGISLRPLDTHEQCLLTLQVKSPVTEAVTVIARIQTPEGVVEREADAAAQPGQGNQVSIDLSDFAGQTIDLEIIYIWAQSSLITIALQSPAAHLVYEPVPVSQISLTILETIRRSTADIPELLRVQISRILPFTNDT